MGTECSRFNRRLAKSILEKIGKACADFMRHVRSRLRYALLKASLVAIKGNRGQRSRTTEVEIEDICFRLIPELKDFKCVIFVFDHFDIIRRGRKSNW